MGSNLQKSNLGPDTIDISYIVRIARIFIEFRVYVDYISTVPREVFLTRQYSFKKRGSWIMDQGSRILDLAPCSGMNDHPGRDTDVRSRPSEYTIKDPSFYIGFIRIGSSIKHLGPCFGTKGHFRRDPDVQSISYQFL